MRYCVIAMVLVLVLVIFSGCQQTTTSGNPATSTPSPVASSTSAPPPAPISAASPSPATPAPVAIASPSPNTPTSGAPKELVYETLKKHIMILGISKDAPALDDKKRSELKKSLEGIDTGKLSGTEKRDFNAWCASLLDLLNEPPSGGFDRGRRSVEPMEKCAAVLSNYDITVAMAKADGHGDLCAGIEMLYKIAKIALFAQCEQEISAMDKVNLISRHFIEYFRVYEGLTRPPERYPFAQVALLSMNPETFEDSATKPSFVSLHAMLLKISHEIHGRTPDKKSELEEQLPLAFFATIVNKGDIKSKDMELGGAPQLTKLVEQFRDLSK